MLHVDMPTRADLESLIGHRGPACISIYLPTTPLTREAQADRIALDNLAGEAIAQLDAATAADDRPQRMRVREMAELLRELVDDDEFWATQARSLAVFVGADRVRTFRLANRLQASVEVADRFHVKPLLRAVTMRHEAFVLALSQDAVRLVEVAADLPPMTVRVPDLPADLADAVGRGSLESRSPRGRLQGAEGKKVRLAQFVRAVDAALRTFLAGRDVPLILAATAPVESIFRAACSYPHLTAQGIGGNPDTVSDHELAKAARGVLDGVHAEEVRTFAELFETRARAGRTTTDVAQAARAATYGAVAALAVDFDAHAPGTVADDDGAVTLAAAASAETHGVVDEIAGRVFTSGGRVLALRRHDIPGGGELAAVLRYAF